MSTIHRIGHFIVSINQNRKGLTVETIKKEHRGFDLEIVKGRDYRLVSNKGRPPLTARIFYGVVTTPEGQDQQQIAVELKRDEGYSLATYLN